MKYVYGFFIGLWCLVFLAGCQPKPELKKAIQNQSIGILSVAWDTNVQGTLGTQVVLTTRHASILTDAFIRRLSTASNSWIRDANSVVLQDAFAFYPETLPPKKEGVALALMPGYKWITLQNPAIATHWCKALTVDTVLTAVLTPQAERTPEGVRISIAALVTVYNVKINRIDTDTLIFSMPLSAEDQKWIQSDPRRLPDVMISPSVLAGIPAIGL